jgi:small membrane protein
MQLIQIMGILISGTLVLYAFMRYRAKRLTLREFILWALLWTGVTIVALLPNIIGRIAGLLGIGRGIDVIIYLSILMLFYLNFRLYMKIDDTQKDITRLVRALALRPKKK